LAGFVGFVGLAILLGAAWAAWQVERDPAPRFLARRSRLLAAVRESRTPAGGSVVERLRLRATSGLAVELAVKRPAEGPGRPPLPGRRPLVVLLGGFETGRDAVDLVADPRGVVLAALSYPYPGPPPAHGARGVLALPRLRAAILDTPSAVLLALDYLLEQPYVDPGRVELVGVSLGAPFAVVAGALDPRVRRVWSVHGAGDLPLLIDTALRGAIPAAPLRRSVARLGYLLAAGPAVAPERWVGRIAPRPFVMLNAADDERMPRRAILALYDRARPPKELLWVSGPHVEPDRRGVVEGLIERVLGRVLRDSGADSGPAAPSPERSR
jgi:dienelactone hydrolase